MFVDRENTMSADFRRAWRSAALGWLVIASAALGCASYQGSAASADHAMPAEEPGWIWVSGVPEALQRGEKDCGAASLSAVLAYWGHPVTPEQIRQTIGVRAAGGVRAMDLTAFARTKGFDAYVFKGALDDLQTELSKGHPVIVGVAKRYGKELLSHYEVVVGYHPAAALVLTLDPALGWRRNSVSGFMSEWDPTGRVVVLVFPATSG
jgi:ABC-type bacteriocin/lantibiotic exporter with double-glycine peptidase domain